MVIIIFFVLSQSKYLPEIFPHVIISTILKEKLKILPKFLNLPLEFIQYNIAL